MSWTPDAAHYDSGRPFPPEQVLRLISESRTWRERIGPDDRKRIFEPGSGTGRILLPLATLFPQAVFFGADTYDDALAVCSNRARLEGVKNIRLANLDLREIDWQQSFDALLHSSVLHSIPEWEAVLEKLLSLLLPSGFILLLGDSGDIHHMALGREVSPGADTVLADFWQQYLEKRAALGLQHPEASQVGCKWDLENEEIAQRLLSLGYKEIERNEIRWEETFSLFDLLSIVENRVCSSMFQADEKVYAEILPALEGQFGMRGREETTSRHVAVARFFSK